MLRGYRLDHYLKEKNKKVIGFMKDKLGSKIMTEFAALKQKTYSYWTDNNEENIHAKGTKKCVAKEKIKSEDHENCLELTQLGKEINYPEKRLIQIV